MHIGNCLGVFFFDGVVFSLSGWFDFCRGPLCLFSVVVFFYFWLFITGRFVLADCFVVLVVVVRFFCLLLWLRSFVFCPGCGGLFLFSFGSYCFVRLRSVVFLSMEVFSFSWSEVQSQEIPGIPVRFRNIQGITINQTKSKERQGNQKKFHVFQWVLVISCVCTLHISEAKDSKARRRNY